MRNRTTASHDRISVSSRRRRIGLAVMATLLFGAAHAAAQSNPAVPVRVGGDFEFPACSARGTLNEHGARSGYAEIGSGPTGSFRAIGRLPVGTEVFVCDENGTFRGIIYGDGDCGLAEPIERRAAYRGTCQSGWVHNRSIDPSDGGAV